MTESLPTKQIDIQVGQVWQENDPRLTRYVKVLGLHGPFGVEIQRCDQAGNPLDEYRKTVALRRRFNGNRSGYKRIS